MTRQLLEYRGRSTVWLNIQTFRTRPERRYKISLMVEPGSNGKLSTGCLNDRLFVPHHIQMKLFFFVRDDLSKLPFLTQCIKEAMRVHSPVPGIGRELSQPLTIGGVLFPKHTQFVVHIFSLHHNPHVWGEDHMVRTCRHAERGFLMCSRPIFFLDGLLFRDRGSCLGDSCLISRMNELRKKRPISSLCVVSGVQARKICS